MPRTDGESLFHVHRRKFDKMFYASGFGGLRCHFVSHGDLGTAIDEEELVDAFKGYPQGRRVGEISDEHIDPIAET
jgi:hypothetical protein